MSTTVKSSRPRRRLVELSALTLNYLLSEFYRSFVAVIAPELAADLQVTAAELGVLSSTFFITVAVAQIPVGLALDRFGAGRTNGCLLLVGALGAGGFAVAQNLTMAIAAQVALGLACAPLLMGLLHYVARKFPRERFVAVSSVGSAVGLVGSLIASAPLGWFANQYGWRAALSCAAAATLVAALASLAIVRDATNDAHDVRESGFELMRHVGAVISIRALWPIIPMAMVLMGASLTFRTVWAGPYFDAVYLVSPDARAAIVLVISLGRFCAAFAAPLVAGRLQPRQAVIVYALVPLAAYAALALAPDANVWLATGLLTIVAFCGSAYAFLMAHGRAFLPTHMIGRGLGVLNSFVFLGIGSANAGVGLVIGLGEAWGVSALLTYRCTFVLLAAALVLALICYRFSTEVPRNPGS